MSVLSQPEVILLWPDGAPGTEDWSHQEQETIIPPPYTNRVVRNVVQPTLTAFLPDPAQANGTAVIICPGGAFHMLSIDHEGIEVARWFNERGVAAFVLKYRLVPTAVHDEDFFRELEEAFSNRPHMRELTRKIEPLASADGRQAMKLVRARASTWGIAPDRIGMLGFSAGGRVTIGVVLSYDAESRPAFAAPIYGALWEGLAVPADAPALFIAVANNDELAVKPSLDLYNAWHNAEQEVELHIYARGGHGFGMNKQGLSSDHWVDALGVWLQQQGMLT